MSLSRLCESLYPLNLNDEVGAPLRPSVVCAPAVGALSFAECGVFLPLAISRVILFGAKDAFRVIGAGASYVAVLLAVVALAYTRSPVV